ncbi:MAG: SIMPL domain-containing protein, partial [Acidobacteria bacterium]|nr:SIMPL domain-containing protein [Acidobacteriota bacterium]
SEQLLESAIENAKWKATVLAKSAGVKLGEIQRIDYNWSELHLYSQTDYQFNDMMLCEAAAPLAMDIEPEEIKVNDTATIVWAIE